MKNKKILISGIVLLLFYIGAWYFIEHKGVEVEETFWALIPPLIAILLALITKEVYSSLFLGILTGALFWARFNPVDTINHVFKDGVISVLSDSWNVGILVFLVILGMMVQLMNKTGGSLAFGRWASTHIKTKVGAQLATILLGVLIFIDDYFNCLTVGSVMRPVTDKEKISREKLSYLIDATAAPICIIAPISSWAAAVAGFVEGENGMSLFLKAIPYNFYALLTILMLILMVSMKISYGPMKKFEEQALTDAYWAKKNFVGTEDEELKVNHNGRVIDMIIPIILLIACCTIGMIYTGGFFDGESFIDAFAHSDASVGLVLGSSVALVLSIIFYLIRGVIDFEECMKCLPDGFKQMVPAILILTFAWSLKVITDNLGADDYVAELVRGSAAGLQAFLPCIIFLIAIGLSFATGTSWGTFGILIPIVVNCFQNTDYTMMIISISACMAGAVCGDHCSPISDTTIMSSAGAECEHINHVTTQLPYALTVAAVSFVTYIVAGLTKSPWISLPVGMALMVLVLLIIKMVGNKKERGLN
ncbi:MAG: Na+/H+ antiporter NhaC family protein [Lachnospiraceae bacterium]|nr:Na+/H+ antiporter NhaC family protein [Lachnospiraceae bacterium]MBQ9579932.1 Na+/H+ antiporter NhaC family protein [Lachnospiraceae bacterium]